MALDQNVIHRFHSCAWVFSSGSHRHCVRSGLGAYSLWIYMNSKRSGLLTMEALSFTAASILMRCCFSLRQFVSTSGICLASLPCKAWRNLWKVCLRDNFYEQRALLGILCLVWHRFTETAYNSVFWAETLDYFWAQVIHLLLKITRWSIIVTKASSSSSM